jgi:hypothetical protein
MTTFLRWFVSGTAPPRPTGWDPARKHLFVTSDGTPMHVNATVPAEPRLR